MRTAFFHQIDRYAHGGVFFTAQSRFDRLMHFHHFGCMHDLAALGFGELMLRERRANLCLLTDQQQARVGMGA